MLVIVLYVVKEVCKLWMEEFVDVVCILGGLRRYIVIKYFFLFFYMMFIFVFF